MDAWMRNQQREDAAVRRQRPVPPHRIMFAAASDGEVDPQDPTPPTDIFLEATDPTGQIAEWFDDIWWMEALRRWGDRSLSIHLLPSPGALVHPVVLHHLVMAQRVAPNWRLIGYGYCAEISGDATVETLATSAYDQVWLVESSRSASSDRSSPHALRIEDLFSRVRRVQQQQGAMRPILVRATSVPPVPGDRSVRRAGPSEPERVSQTLDDSQARSDGKTVPEAAR